MNGNIRQFDLFLSSCQVSLAQLINAQKEEEEEEGEEKQKLQEKQTIQVGVLGGKKKCMTLLHDRQ